MPTSAIIQSMCDKNLVQSIVQMGKIMAINSEIELCGLQGR